MSQFRVSPLPTPFFQLKTTARCSVNLTPLHRQVVLFLFICQALAGTILGMQLLRHEDDIPFEVGSKLSARGGSRRVYYLSTSRTFPRDPIVLQMYIGQVV